MSERIDEIKARAFKAIGGTDRILPEDVSFLLSELERVERERDEAMQCSVEMSGAECGWKAQRDRLRQALEVAKVKLYSGGYDDTLSEIARLCGKD